MDSALQVADSVLAAMQAWRFDNRFVRELPGDPVTTHARRQVKGACYSRVDPTPCKAPRLLAWSPEVCRLLDLPDDPSLSQAFADVFAGKRLLPGMEPFAMCYGGHQFGTWAGQLGDGRAINLGEVVSAAGQRHTLQLKGAGPTPYSRTADGLAVLRSSLREFVCSEAMHHLGIPTTRALSLVLTGDQVVRDMFYDGRPQAEAGAIVGRVSPSFVRFGNFEILAARGEHENLRRLLAHAMGIAWTPDQPPSAAQCVDWFAGVCERTADLVVHWMRVGFVHGVMNTDNMSILGETIDFGPYGWLDHYDPEWTPNTTDAEGRRYCFGAQPQVALWNLVCLANALVPVAGSHRPLEEVLNGWSARFFERWRSMMAAKLGLDHFETGSDESLVDELLELLAAAETDYSIFFRHLARLDLRSARQASAEDRCDEILAPPRPVFGERGAGGEGRPRNEVRFAPELPTNPPGLWLSPTQILSPSLYSPVPLSPELAARWCAWFTRYVCRLERDRRDPATRQTAMDAVNPAYVFRNYLAQQAIDRATTGDTAFLFRLLNVLRHPYTDQPGCDEFAARRPDWARHRPGCSMLSCSS